MAVVLIVNPQHPPHPDDGEVGARNSHLVKLYAVSLIQLTFVLAVVVLFTEIKEVIRMMIALLFFSVIWVVKYCTGWDPHIWYKLRGMKKTEIN